MNIWEYIDYIWSIGQFFRNPEILNNLLDFDLFFCTEYQLFPKEVIPIEPIILENPDNSLWDTEMDWILHVSGR